MAKSPRNRLNIFATRPAAQAAAQAEKMTLAQSIKQNLAECSDLYEQGEEQREKASSIADKEGRRLYKGRIDGLFTSDEVSNILGDVFGYRMKGDAKTRVKATDKEASKTPFGVGEMVRKRIVRAVNAAEFLDNPRAGGRFFEEISPKDIEPIIDQLNDEKLSLWTAYDKISSLRRQNIERTSAAFDPKKVAAMADSLGQEGAISTIQHSPALLEAYKYLFSAISSVGEEIAESASENDNQPEEETA